MKKSVFVLFSSFCFMGCTHETIGRISGGAAGALIGSQIGGGTGRMVATAIGALVGSQIGEYLGKQISQAEKDKIADAVKVAIQEDKAVSWSGEQHDFTVQPIPGQRNKKKVKKVCILMKERGGPLKEVTVNAIKNKDGTYSFV